MRIHQHSPHTNELIALFHYIKHRNGVKRQENALVLVTLNWNGTMQRKMEQYYNCNTLIKYDTKQDKIK